jgi:hypothetical protein
MKTRRYGRLEQQKRLVRAAYDAFGLIGTTFRELNWKRQSFSRERSFESRFSRAAGGTALLTEHDSSDSNITMLIPKE